MRFANVVCYGAVMVSGFLGCSHSDQPQDDAEAPSVATVSPQGALGGVAVVDLDEVAKRLARDVQMSREVADKEIDLNEKLSILKDAYQDQYAKEKDLAGANPSDEQAEKLAALDRQLGMQIREAQRQAQAEMALLRQSLAQRFREEVKPVARKIAAQRGLSIVITETRPLLLSVDPQANITDEVIEKMLASSTPPTAKAEQTPQVSISPPRDGEFQR